MNILKRFVRDDEGAATIEMAIAFPAFISMVWGIFQLGIAFQAQAGMQHALGMGARYATLYPKPTNDAIKTYLTSRVYGTGNGTFTVSTPVDGTTSDGVSYKTLTVAYTMPLNFLFVNAGTMNITRSKRVYTTYDESAVCAADNVSASGDQCNV